MKRDVSIVLKYEEIMEYIKKEISNGTFHHKTRLPSVRFISEQFNCSIGTVLKAYKNLELEHVIYSSPKSGYYVLEDINYNHSTNPSIIDFSAGTPDVVTFPYKSFQHCLNKATEIYKETLFTYCDPRGLTQLRTVLTKQLQNYQVFTKPENIIITSGTQQALTILSLMPFPNQKKKILVEQPTYYGMIKCLEINNIPAIGIERGLNGIDLDALETIFKTEDIKFFYTVPRFHNPTGNSYNKQEKEMIVELAEKYDVYIIEDDIVADLDLDKKNDPMFSYDTRDRVIYLKSYSKILMPGLMIAVLAVPTLLVDTFLEYKKWIDTYSPILSQGALEIYLKNGMFDIQKKEVTKLYVERMICLKNVLSNYSVPQINWFVPQSGYFGCLYTEKNLDYKEIVTSLQMKNIELFDTSQCFLKEYRNHNYVRISISQASTEKIKKGIPIVLDTIKEYLS